MELCVDLGPRAHRDELAVRIRERVQSNLRYPSVARAFSRMWGTVVVVQRIPPHDQRTPRALRLRELTLRFDYGRLVIHGGRVGRPDVTLWGTADEILRMGETSPPVGAAVTGGWAASAAVLAALRTALGGPADGNGVQIFGRRSHLRLVFRLARLLQRRR